MASWLEQQIAALQAQGFDVSPDALAAQIPQGYDAMPEPAQAPPPQAPPPAPPLSLWGGVKTGAARDGLVGGLVGTFANPMQQAPQGEANTYQAVTGILRNVGRAIGSAYGNPNYAQQGRALDQRDTELARRQMFDLANLQQDQEMLSYKRDELGMARDKSAREEQKARQLSAAEQAVVRTFDGKDHNDPRVLMEAAHVAFANGATDLGTKLQEAAQKAGKAPEAPPVKDFYTPDGRVDQRQWDGTQWVTVGSGPRFQDPTPRAPVAVVGPDGNDVYVAPGDAIGKTPANQAESEITKATRTALEKEQINYTRDLGRLNESISNFDPNIFTYAGRAGRALQGVASSAGKLSPEAAAKFQEQAGYVQRIAMLSAELIHNLYGGALTPGEEARANQFIVSRDDSPDQAIAKLNGLKAQYESKIRANAEALKHGVRGLGAQQQQQTGDDAALTAGGADAKDTPTGNTVGGKPVMRRPDGSMYVVE